MKKIKKFKNFIREDKEILDNQLSDFQEDEILTNIPSDIWSDEVSDILKYESTENDLENINDDIEKFDDFLGDDKKMIHNKENEFENENEE